MAKILYGVMGNTYGHLMRTMAIATRLPEHEFYFVGGGRVPSGVEAHGYSALDVPVLRTVHRKGKVSVPAVMGQIANRVFEIPKIVRQIRGLMDKWQPDYVFCDREFFLPLACKQAKIECTSIDHSHVLKVCEYPVPRSQWISWALAMANDYALFDFTRRNFIVSFFQPPLRKRFARLSQDHPHCPTLLPPVLRKAVTEMSTAQKDHVLVYQTSATFRPLLAPLRQLNRPVIVYGLNHSNTARTEGNLIFKPFHEMAILEDLASCAYAVVNGGHNLICEALYFQKPVLCFPIATLFEQFINAWHVRALHYGDFSLERNPDFRIFSQFENQLDHYRSHVQHADIDGTERVVEAFRKTLSPCASLTS